MMAVSAELDHGVFAGLAVDPFKRHVLGYLGAVPAGVKVAAGCAGGALWIVDAQSGTVDHVVEHGPKSSIGSPWATSIYSVRWNPAGTKLATSGSDDRLRIVDALAGAVEQAIHLGCVVSTVEWNPAGTKIAACCRDDRLRIVDLLDGTVHHEVAHGGFLFSVDWSPDGTKVATGSVKGMRIVDAATGRTDHEVVPGTGVISVAWNPAGTKIAAGSYDGMLRIVDGVTGAIDHEVVHCGGKVAWNPDGTKVATGSYEGRLQIVDVNEGRAEHTVIAGIGEISVAWNAPGTKVATGSNDSKLRIVDVLAGTIEHELDLGLPWTSSLNPLKNLFSVAWNPAGMKVASGGDDAMLRVVDAETGAVDLEVGLGGIVFTIAWSPSGW